jgi:hypothetical protein
MAIKQPLYPYSEHVKSMVVGHYRSGTFMASWEARKHKDETYFNSLRHPAFPYKDMLDEFDAKRGSYSNLAKLVRVLSAADGWPEDLCEHFGRLSMHLAARAETLLGRCTPRTMFLEGEREIVLLKAFYGSDVREEEWPHCSLIACDYAIRALEEQADMMLYGDDIDL